MVERRSHFLLREIDEFGSLLDDKSKKFNEEKTKLNEQIN